MSCTGTSNCNCGCCAGSSVLTPQSRSNNLPGLASLPYRVGTWASFRESMLAQLSSSEYPALAALKTRDDDDFTIAFLDASAIVLDILTFYQERLANESYLRTAGQSRSLTELSRLIGYQPSPGVSASAYVAFTLKTAPGQPTDPSAPAITIPQGTQVQSVPAQGQTPQIFETFANIQAKPDWTALPVQTSRPWNPRAKGIYLSGTSTQLQLGDALLILGPEREQWTSAQSSMPSSQWDVVILNQVQTDPIRNLTYVSWDQPLIHTFNLGPAFRETAKVFALRQKAALFGNNAPSPYLFVNPTSSGNPNFPNLITVVTGSNPPVWQWNLYFIASPSQIDLDATYPKVVAGGWFALTSFQLTGGGGVNRYAQLYKVQSAHAVSRSSFALSGKVTELAADYQDPAIASDFPLQQTEVLAQSEQLAVAEQPLSYPLYGTLLDLQDLRPDLVGLQVVALSGVSQKISVNGNVTTLQFVPDDQSGAVSANPGDVFVLIDPGPLPLNADGTIPPWRSGVSATLKVQDANGRTGALQGAGGVSLALSQISLAPSSSNDPEIGEYALVSSLSSVTEPYPHTQIQLQSALANCYDRTATTVNANVGLATNGQSVTEIMGSGNGSMPDQSFTLKQSPLTYVQAPTPTGRLSTLQVQVNGVAWTEVPSLYDQSPTQQVFSTLNQSDGTTDVLFGDGEEGALLPTGQNNLVANYRIGLGSSGNVGANTLTTLVDRPLGVSGVTNPEAATGGQDPQSIADIRSNAPLTVLTLGRAVSLEDYENYASTFAGIAKAYALWIPSGSGQGVFLTVAAVGGVPLPPGNPTLANLVASLQNYGNPLIPITAQSFLETLFGLSADIRYDPAYDQPTVQAQVLRTLSQAYSFAARTFGQGVSVDEVATVIQAVPGVIAVNVKELHTVATSTAGDLGSQMSGFSLSKVNSWRALALRIPLIRPLPTSITRIYPYLPVANPNSLPQPAEILVLDPDPSSVVLGVMS
jgi:Baseplate J-like protein